MNELLKFDAFVEMMLNEGNTQKLKKGDIDGVFNAYKKNELTKTDSSKAWDIAVRMMGVENAKNIYESKNKFKENYEAAKESAEANGKYKRGEMPVINNSNFTKSGVGKEDTESAERTEQINNVLSGYKDLEKDVKKAVLSNQVVAFKFLVGHGFIDINGDNDDDKVKNATQNSLKDDDALAEKWLSSGDKGEKSKKDVIPGKFENISVKDLKPIQEQIFIAKSIKMAAGAKGDIKKMDWLIKAPDVTKYNNSVGDITDFRTPFVLVSSDDYILDGHHRWLGAYLINPDAKMACIRVDMKKDELLELTNKFTGAIGNKPNVKA